MVSAPSSVACICCSFNAWPASPWNRVRRNARKLVPGNFLYQIPRLCGVYSARLVHVETLRKPTGPPSRLRHFSPPVVVRCFPRFPGARAHLTQRGALQSRFGGDSRALFAAAVSWDGLQNVSHTTAFSSSLPP